MSFLSYANKSYKKVVQAFDSSEEFGLKINQVTIHKKKYGQNSLLPKEKTRLAFFISQYKSPLILLLLGAAIVSLLLGEYINAAAIFLIILANTFISFYQEYRATKSIKFLGRYLNYTSKVIRNAKMSLIANKHLVPGDIVFLEPGDYIPADIRFIEAHNLSVDESRFSGELLPVVKTDKELNLKHETIFQAHNIGFSGTMVIEGSGKGIVFAIGHESFLGKIGDLTISTIRDTRFFKNVKKISIFLVQMISVTLVSLIIAHLIFKPITSLPEMLMFAIALAVGIAPEALPTVTTFALSKGAMLLARNNVIVKRLSSIEDLGGLEIICTDKTGTITENALTVSDTYVTGKLDPIFYMALASTQPFTKDKKPTSPFDYAAWNNLSKDDFTAIEQYQRLTSAPFDAQHKRNLVVVKKNADAFLIAKGAYEEIIKKSIFSPHEEKKISAWITTKASTGCRVIAVAHKKISLPLKTTNIWELENEMEFIGLIALHDPLKRGVKDTIKKSKELGLEVKIITGDGPEIAGQIAYTIGLINDPTKVIVGEKFAQLSDSEKQKNATTFSVFSRFSPEQKAEVINVLKKEKSVAYLGDGINDAPALKAADVGLAVNVATDIAKDSADIVLLKKSLKTIVDGIVIGRKIFVNTSNYLKITLASNLGNFYSIAFMSFFIPFLPLLPLQILLVNLLSDTPMIAIATDNVQESEIDRPTSYHLKNLIFFVIIFGFLSSLFDLIFFYSIYKGKAAFFQTNWFIFSIITEVLFIFSARTKQFFIKAQKPSTSLLVISVLIIVATISIPFSFIGQNLFSFISPAIKNLMIIITVSTAYFISCELFKPLYYFFIKKK